MAIAGKWPVMLVSVPGEHARSRLLEGGPGSVVPVHTVMLTFPELLPSVGPGSSRTVAGRLRRRSRHAVAH
jgi:hypothetical protein